MALGTTVIKIAAQMPVTHCLRNLASDTTGYRRYKKVKNKESFRTDCY